MKKVNLKSNIKILHKWSNGRIDLSEFLRGKFAKYNEYKMLYVVQSQNDITNNVYKVGVSSGIGRLKEYTKHHGDPKQDVRRCAGANLLYLAGTRAKSRSRKSTAGKIDGEIEAGYIYRLPWSRKREKEIKNELKSKGFKAVRGTEWFKIPNRSITEFKSIVTSLDKVVLEEAAIEPRRSDRLQPETRTSKKRNNIGLTYV